MYVRTYVCRTCSFLPLQSELTDYFYAKLLRTNAHRKDSVVSNPRERIALVTYMNGISLFVCLSACPPNNLQNTTAATTQWNRGSGSDQQPWRLEIRYRRTLHTYVCGAWAGLSCQGTVEVGRQVPIRDGADSTHRRAS